MSLNGWRMPMVTVGADRWSAMLATLEGRHPPPLPGFAGRKCTGAPNRGGDALARAWERVHNDGQRWQPEPGPRPRPRWAR